MHFIHIVPIVINANNIDSQDRKILKFKYSVFHIHRRSLNCQLVDFGFSFINNDNRIMNWIDLIFIYFTLTVVVFAIFINVSESNISPLFLQTFRYGKHAYKGKPSRFVQAFEVPKSYFKHFYVFAIIWAILIFGLTFNVYVLGTGVPNWIIDTLDLLCGSDRVASGKKND